MQPLCGPWALLGSDYPKPADSTLPLAGHREVISRSSLRATGIREHAISPQYQGKDLITRKALQKAHEVQLVGNHDVGV